MSNLLDLVRKGVKSVSGLLAFVAVVYGGLAMLWLVMKAPEAFALVAGASVVGAAIYFRGPTKVYNMQMSHPETEEVLSAVRDLLQRNEKSGN